MHKLLARQLRRAFPSEADVPAEIRPFIAVVDEAYRQSDEDRALLEHSMETVSQEMIDRFRRLQDALTESQRAAENVNRVLSLLTATLESTADGILVVDQQNKIIRTNRKFADLWRIPETVLSTADDDTVLAFALDQLTAPDAFLQKVRELDDHADAESFDVLHFKDGRVFERFSLPHRVGGHTVGRVWSFRDVSERDASERRRLEEQFRHSQKMEAVGALASGVAHDFNNLLTVIRAHADFLGNSVGSAGEERDDVNEIMRATDRAAGLTRQLLAFSRKQNLQPVVLDICSLATGVESMLRRLVTEDIAMTTICAQEHGFVLADPGQLEQVLINLVVNARDAMPRGGRMTIETGSVDLDDRFELVRRGACSAGPYVVLAVSDTGIGIPPELRDRIFEPFFTTKGPEKGTGLGLSTVHAIASQAGGHVVVESEEGVGTTFKVYLPRTEELASSARAAAPDRPVLEGSETILLVEDEGAVRDVARRILARHGYTLLVARHGRDALKVAAEYRGRIDLVVTDMIMPELGGRALVEQLQAVRPDIGAIYMSGYTDAEIGWGGMVASGRFLQKPFTDGGLAQMVRTVLDVAGVASSKSQACSSIA